MLPGKINLKAKLADIHEHWRPHIVGELNGQEVRLVKLQGEFVWHQHDEEDEAFLVLDGRLRVEFRDGAVELDPGEMLVVPRGLEHRTAADQETAVLLLERAGARNTGNVEHPTLTAPRGLRV